MKKERQEDLQSTSQSVPLLSASSTSWTTPMQKTGSEKTKTGINLTPNPSPKGEGSDYWYSLDGRRLSGKPTQKGIYINNGRKIVIK